MSKRGTKHQSTDIIFTFRIRWHKTQWLRHDVTTGDSNPNLHNIKRKVTQKHPITTSPRQSVFETVHQKNRDDRRKLPNLKCHNTERARSWSLMEMYYSDRNDNCLTIWIIHFSSWECNNIDIVFWSLMVHNVDDISIKSSGLTEVLVISEADFNISCSFVYLRPETE